MTALRARLDKACLLVVACSLIIFLMSFSVLSGCTSNPAPVSSRAQPPSQRLRHHIVAPGDTLYAIAWRYETSVKALARSNGLSYPYTIIPGQRLSLDASVSSPRRQTVVKTSPANTVSKNNKTTHTSKGKTTTKAEPARNSAATTPPVAVKTHKLPTGKVKWRWPVKGSVSRQYDTSKVFKGINIQSRPGREVSAAASGVVVYAGSGLRGYGKLIIIKHSDIYLSAYAHNRALSVKEGDAVKAGAKISIVGGDANNPGRLYFELRKNGKPVDPMRLLPRQ